VDFQGARFVNCEFRGPLRDVIFRREGVVSSRGPKNELEHCDFAAADVTLCKFIEINMRREWFGQRDDIIYLTHGPEDWRRWLERFVGDSRFPGLHILLKSVVDCGTPAIASRKFLRECGFTDEEIDGLDEISNASQSK
jgi:hypothetical protein